MNTNATWFSQSLAVCQIGRRCYPKRLHRVAALVGALTLLPAPVYAATAFIQLFETDSGHSVCDRLCNSTITNTAPINYGPTTLTGSGGATYISASGVVGPSPISSFVTGNVAVEYNLGIADTYTVHGTAVGPFSITTTFGATGTMSTVPSGPFNVFVGSVNVKIGTYDLQVLPFPSGPVDYISVIPFDPSSQATTGGVILRAAGSVPVDISASYTRTVSVGDTFDIAYQLQSGFALGTIDLSHTASISFLLPDGVYLTSALGSVFGDAPTTPGAIPIPAAFPLLATGLGGLALLTWRRNRTKAAAAA